MTKLNTLLSVTLSAFLLTSAPVLSQELIIYPSAGQSQEQLDKDKFECYSWAKQSSNFDPMAPPTTSTPAPQKEAQEGGLVRGAARGALTGLAVGAIAGDAGQGAAIGAAGGGLIGGMRRNDQKKQETLKQEQWAEKEITNYSQQRANYNRAYSACLEGKQYTVK